MPSELQETGRGLEITKTYVMFGLVLLMIGFLFFLFNMIEEPQVRRGGGRSDPITIIGLGIAATLAGIGLLGTVQRLRYDKVEGTLSYRSKVAFMGGYHRTFSVNDVVEILYRKVHTRHIRRGYGNENHVTEAGFVVLFTQKGGRVELCSVTHTDEFRDGLKVIAEAMGVKFDRQTEHTEERMGL